MSRSNISKIGVIAVLLAVAGCGGGGGGSSPPTSSISGAVTSFATGAPLAQGSVMFRAPPLARPQPTPTVPKFHWLRRVVTRSKRLGQAILVRSAAPSRCRSLL
jgi:hypothetical protein